MVKISLNPETNLQETPDKGINFSNRAIDLDAPAYTDPSVQHLPYDSMNFTNMYRDDISKYKKYGVPTSRYFDWNNVRAQNQGTAEKWGRGIKKMGVTTTGALLENTLGVVAGIGQLVSGGNYYDNFVGNSVDKMNEWMREEYPNYYTERERDMNTWQKLGTANFWADTVANGVGYSLGSIGTMFLTGGTGLIGKGAKMLGTYNTAKAVSTGKKLVDVTKGGTSTSGLITATNALEVGLYMSLAESSVEARETQKRVYEDIIQKVIEDPNNNINHKRDLTRSELRDIEEVSYNAANSHFVRQIPILMGSNILMFGRGVAGFNPKTKNIFKSSDVGYNAATKQAVDKLADVGIAGRTLGRLKPLGIGAGVEAIQEGWQFGSNIISSDYHTNKYFNGGTADLTASIRKGITDTFGTQEGFESMLVGAIVGGGVSGTRSMITRDSEGRGEYGQRQAASKYATDVLNGGYFNNVENKRVKYSAQEKVAKDMEIALQEVMPDGTVGNIKAFKDAQYKLIQYQAYDALENGTFEVFKQKLEDTKTLSDKDFAELFGYNSELSIADQTKSPDNVNGQSKDQIIKNILDKTDKFEKVYNKINAKFPSLPKLTGVPAMLTSKEKLEAHNTVALERESLRDELILSMSAVENRNERLDSVQKKMQDLLAESSKMNGIPMIEEDFNLHSVLNQEDFIDPKGGFNRIKQKDALVKAFDDISKKLADKGAKADIAPFQALATDYVDLFMDNATAIERYNNLASSKYSQDLFNKLVKENQEAAKQTATDASIKENIKEAKTADEVKDSVTDEAGPEAKTEAREKIKNLTKEENNARREYMNLHKGKPFEDQLKSLQKLAKDNPDLTPTQKAGLTKAIEILENKLKRNQQADEIKDTQEDTSIEDLKTAFSVEDEVVREENDDAIDKKKPEPRVVTRVAPESTREAVPTAEGQLNVVSAVNGAEVVEVQVPGQPTKYKIPVNDEGRVINPEADTVGDKIIRLKPQLLLADDIIGTEVEFEIIENDKWKSGEIRDLNLYPEDWMQIPIYYKIGDAYVGKLEGSTNEDRKAIVDRLQKGQKVKTKISEILATNFNNAVDSTGAIAFSNPLEIFGDQIKKNDDISKQDDIILGFTRGMKEGETVTVQWTLSEVDPDKNRNNEVDTIATQVQRTPTPRAYYQIGIVVKDENNPQGVARMSMASTANLNPKAQELVFNYIANQEYDKASEIVASSNLEYDSRKGAELSSAYLEFAKYLDGRQDVVYYSDALSGLIRITADEMSKALNPNYEGPVSFALVKEKNNEFVGSKTDSVKTKIDIASDLKGFLQTKKYNVQRGVANMKTPYTSPVTNLPYETYQEYLFSSKELGEDVERIDGVGHNSILATDLVKKYQHTDEVNTYSLFNSPRVTFEKGNILGETASEVIKNTKITETSPEAPVAPVAQQTSFKILNKEFTTEDSLFPTNANKELAAGMRVLYDSGASIELSINNVDPDNIGLGSPIQDADVDMTSFGLSVDGNNIGVLAVNSKTNEIVNVEILPEFRGLGLGTKLYKAAAVELGGLISDPSFLSNKAENIWKSLVKQGLAVKTNVKAKGANAGYAMIVAKKKTTETKIKKSSDSQLNMFFDNLDKCD